MVNIRYRLVAAVFLLSAMGHAQALCDHTDSFLDTACQTVSDTWTQGDHDLYVPFYSYHFRFAYSKEKIDSFRENTWGIGYGRTRYDESGNIDNLYGMTFQDSHSKPEYIVGYAHQWVAGQPKGLHAGLGYTIFLTARSDIYHYTPIPMVLPIASVSYDKVSVNTAYVPGGKGNGNVLFFWTKFGF